MSAGSCSTFIWFNPIFQPFVPPTFCYLRLQFRFICCFVIMEYVVGAVGSLIGDVAGTAIVEGFKYVKDAIVSGHPKVLLQPVQDLQGSVIEAAQTQLQEWLNEPNPQARVIGLYGMPGVGKASILRVIHNDCKKKVSTNFDLVIWHIVSQNHTASKEDKIESQKDKIASLQNTIAESVGLDLSKTSCIDTRKMELYASLEKKKFILILDDVWSPIDLEQEVGINFGDDNSSRVLISSRRKDVVETMGANEYCMEIKPLSTEDGWELFRRKAFRNGAAPQKNVEATAKQIAEECQGLPLALITVAAALARKKSADEWSRALDLMGNVDPSFPSTHPTIDAQLYQRLRWSYNDLPSSNLKMCFLYCGAFPEDYSIPVDTLVEMWTAVSLVPQKEKSYYMDVGRGYIDALVDRCLIQYVDVDEDEEVDEIKKYIRVHDVLRDMAIYVGQGEGEEKCLFLSSQHLQRFPNEKQTRDCKRISLLDNEISNLPTTDLRCPNLESLVLAQNRQLKEIPETFFVNLMSLKVLDLSETAIETLPASVGQLGQLQCLHLRVCHKLKELPDSICNLSHLQFLNLEHCDRLEYLPDRIGELKHLKHLLWTNYRSSVNPHQICQLTSLNRLVLPRWSTPMSLEDLSSLSNLIELNVTVKPETKRGSMSSWSEMRQLTLSFSYDDDADDVFSEDDADAVFDLRFIFNDAVDVLDDADDAVFDLRFIFSEDDADDVFDLRFNECEDDAVDALDDQNMQSMQELQYLDLCYYRGVSLPNCISNFQNLKELYLNQCTKVKELPGSDAASDGFPVLERLELYCLESLESIVWNYLFLWDYRGVSLPNCISNFQNLKVLYLYHCTNLKELPGSDASSDGFPVLERLQLDSLNSLESIVWNEKSMLKLEYLWISDCAVLKTFRTEELPNLRRLKLWKCYELSDVSQIGSLPMLERLELELLEKLGSIAHWNDKTMPNLRKLRVVACPLLRRLPEGLDKLSNLKEIEGRLDWWNAIFWENHHNVNGKLSLIFRESRY